MVRNSISGPEIGLPGRISAGFKPGNAQNQPSGGHPGGLESSLLDHSSPT
jgi:hypothetical protein